MSCPFFSGADISRLVSGRANATPQDLLCGAFIAMVQATESRMRNHASPSRGANSTTRRVFSQPQMRAIVVIVVNVIRKKSFQMSLVHSDDVIEQITTAASYRALSHSVLPGAPDRGLHASDLQRAKSSVYFLTEFLVVIEKQEPGNGLVRKRFS